VTAETVFPAFVFVAIGLVACGATNPTAGGAVAPVAPPSGAAGSAPLADRDWGVLRSRRFFLEVPLPDLRGWHVDDRSGRWLVAIHPLSHSTLYVRAWREGSVVSRDYCEASARRLRPDLFGADASELVARRSIPGPEGFDMQAGFAVRPVGGALTGVVAASGAMVRRCLVVAYTTDAAGANAEADLAKRLAFFTERILSRATSLTVDDRVKPIER
jgi:hypothetical protein